MTDAELRRLLVSSPRDGRQAVFDLYVNYVYAIVWSKLRGCGSREDAEEVVSDVFAEVFRTLDPGAEGSIGGFVGTVAKRRAISAYRVLVRQSQTMSLDEMDDLPDSTDIVQETEQAATCRILLEQVRALGEPDATIVFAKYFYGRNAAQIARITGMKPAAVRQRLRRAVQKLRTALEQAGLDQM